jgi:phosphoserine phosphatase
MAVLPSIGTLVSFFYQLPLATFANTSPLHSFAVADHFVLLCQQGALSLYCERSLEFPAAAAFTLPQPHSGGVVRLFGEGLTWSVAAQIVAVISGSEAVHGNVYCPHPLLAGALEFAVTPLSAGQQQQLADTAARLQVEAVYLQQRPQLSAPGVLVMDMDSTAIQIECIDEIAKLAGVGEQVAAVTARAMNGELDFAQSLVARVATLQGASQQILQQVLAAIPLMPGLTELVAHLQAHQWQVAIASGGFTYFTDALRQRLNLTATYANVLEIEHGLLTGKVLGDIVDASTKARVVDLLAAEYHIAASQTVAIGDGANDIPMLQAAGLGVAFHAKPKVQAQAKAAIRQGSLLQLLYLLDQA